MKFWSGTHGLNGEVALVSMGSTEINLIRVC